MSIATGGPQRGDLLLTLLTNNDIKSKVFIYMGLNIPNGGVYSYRIYMEFKTVLLHFTIDMHAFDQLT